jgi:hypothetical protein
VTRAFTDRERVLLLTLVSGAEQEAAMRAQIQESQYGEAWFGGSQSFTIVPIGAASGSGGESPLGRTPGPCATVLRDGSKPATGTNLIGEVVLWLEGGRLTDLEYWWVTDEMPDALPDPTQLIRKS